VVTDQNVLPEPAATVRYRLDQGLRERPSLPTVRGRLCYSVHDHDQYGHFAPTYRGRVRSLAGDRWPAPARTLEAIVRRHDADDGFEALGQVEAGCIATFDQDEVQCAEDGPADAVDRTPLRIKKSASSVV
jgi:hypothetical protein